MRSTLRQSVLSPHRPAFTLVELLVALSIFVILVTLTVGGFRATIEADRSTNSVSAIRNAFEGARSRAVKSAEIRGIRLIADSNNPRIATSYVYIGSAGLDEGPVGPLPATPLTALNYHFLDEDINRNGKWDKNPTDEDANGDGDLDIPGWYFAALANSSDTQGVVFNTLAMQGFLDVGNRIRFTDKVTATSTMANPDPIFTDAPWYTIRHIELDANENGIVDPEEDINDNGLWDVLLVEFVNPSEPSGTSGDYTHQYADPLFYQVELSPTILPGAEPVTLPRGSCIDLDSSRLPAGWRIVEDTNGNGALDGAETDGSEADPKIPSGAFEFSLGYTTYMDLLFTPQGTMLGSLASEGVLHFVIASTDDVDAFQNNTNTGRTRALGGSFPVGTGSPYPSWWIQADANKDRKVLSIFTQSGSSLITDVYTPGDTNNSFNDEAIVGVNPFWNALRGKESKQ